MDPEKKPTDVNAYMRNYMKKKYKENPLFHRKYKNSLNIRKKYNITDEVWEKYKENLYAVVSMKEMIDELPNGFFEQFLMDYKTLRFEKKPETTE